MKPCEIHQRTLLGAILQSRSEAFDSGENSHLLRDLATREYNAFLWFALISITVLLLGEVVRLLRVWVKAKKIPGPPCPSFYGHCKLISRENFTDLLAESHEKYGSLVKLWLGPTQLLVSITDPMLIKEMLLKAADKLPLSGRAFHLAFGQSSLFASSFDKVQKKRKLLGQELDGMLLERADLIPEKVIASFMDRIQKIMAKGNIDCKFVSQHMAFTIMGATFFGDDFLAWSKAAVYEELLMMISKDACFWASYNVTPFWKQGFWRYQRLCSKLKCLTQDIFQQCQKNCNIFHHRDQIVQNETLNIQIETASGAKSCSDAVFQDFSKLGDHHNATEEPCGNIMRMMLHGCQTTTGLIDNMLSRLAMHPEIQDKIYSEIVMVGKESLEHDQQDVYKMLLLLATVYESARLLPAGRFLQRCSLKHDLSLHTGVTIPAGAVLVVPVHLVQMDDSSWGPDASKFNPYRFLSNARKGSDVVLDTSSTGSLEELKARRFSSFVFSDPNDNAAFLLFGSGTRACVGQRFVIQQVATLFASLLKKYERRPRASDIAMSSNFKLDYVQ
ncbi:putative Cytochrome P450 [Quillaja saponaria]|uniref:Cytochrome P450 n=1 Tax=Quillaja saponaria TaxID=32244 RepID=A0AAD7PC31_QUISA|nr:putative Cytochrome P450 [Quillaja saponaria]